MRSKKRRPTTLPFHRSSDNGSKKTASAFEKSRMRVNGSRDPGLRRRLTVRMANAKMDSLSALHLAIDVVA